VNRSPVTGDEGEVREPTAAEMSLMQPIADVDPGMAKAARNLGGRPKSDAPKTYIGFRFVADVVAHIKASGKGYNARVEKVLRDALDRGKL